MALCFNKLPLYFLHTWNCDSTGRYRNANMIVNQTIETSPIILKLFKNYPDTPIANKLVGSKDVP